MANYFTGTLLASPIVRGSSGDTYGTHHSILGVGGYMEVNSLTERNALPVDTVNGINFDGISSGQRRIGMLVYVHADDTIYQLKIVEATWSGLTTAGKLIALANNSNWIVFVAGSTETNGENITKTFEQLTHGFVVGDVIGYDGSVFLKVSTTTASTVEPLGMVTEVIDANNFKLTFSGYVSTVGMVDVNSSGLTGGTMYYISSTAGKIISTAPTGMTEISKPVLVALSGDTGVVLQYRGLYETITSGGTVSYEEFTGYTATTQLYLDKTITGATNLGYFTGYTGIQTLPIDHLSNNIYDGNYVSLYNNYYRDDLGYIRIGVASDNLPRRGYLRATLPDMSWIWNEYTGDSASIGWIFVAADVSSDAVYGTKVTGSSIGFSLPEYTATTWTEGQFYNNGSQVVINSVLGNLTTGTTYVVGGPVYRDTVDKELRLRTIVSETPEISVKYDDYFIKISGTSAVSSVANVGTGVGVYSGTTGTTLLFKSLVGGGDTTILDNGAQIIISSTGGGGTGGSGENVTKTITQSSHGFALNEAIGWSSGAYTKAIADGTYDGEILGIVTNVINTDTFNLTQSGYITGLTGFVTNSTYFVSPTVAGALTLTAPTTVGHLVKSMFIANSATSGWVLPYPGYIITPPITGGTGGGTGSTYYTGATPSTCAVGGMSVGTTLTGRTLSALLEEILVPTIYPDITTCIPSNSFVKSPTTVTYEVGSIISPTTTASFNKGEILLSGAFQNYRSGNVNCYYYSGCQLPASVASTSLSNVQSITNFVVSAGTYSWNSCVGYDCGPQPLDSNGDPACSPLSAGITGAQPTSVCGIYPYYWGKETCGTRPAVTNDLVTGGTKVVGNSTSTVTVTFGSSSSEYTWLAIPQSSTSKTCWFVNALDNGDINNAPSDKYPDECVISVCSADGCWSSVNYKVYMSGLVGAITAPMLFRNS